MGVDVVWYQVLVIVVEDVVVGGGFEVFVDGLDEVVGIEYVGLIIFFVSNYGGVMD